MTFINFLKSNGVSTETSPQKDGPNVHVDTEHNSNRVLQKGTTIKVIKYRNSPYNIYKGYIGEIKDYKRDMDTALVFLHAISSFNLIRLPLEHFIVIKT